MIFEVTTMIFDLKKCLYCNGDITKHQDAFDQHPCIYDCKRCGRVILSEDAVHLFDSQGFDYQQKCILSIVSRNNHENRVTPIQRRDYLLRASIKLSKSIGH